MTEHPVTTSPLLFGAAGRTLFGVLDRPAAGQQVDRGVLICAPLGYENLIYYRHLHALARRLAADGRPTLRFDWPGCGDSEGDERSPDLVEASLAAVAEAALRLREWTGVRAVDLVGVRVGATLASVEACRLHLIEDIVLWAPFTSGRSYERALKAFHRLTDQGIKPRGPVPDPPGLESGGFLLSPPAVEALRQIDLSTLPFGPSRRMLVSGFDGPADPALVAHLESESVDVDSRELPGLQNLGLRWEQDGDPLEAIGTIASWLRPGRPMPRPDGPSRLPARAVLGDGHTVEEAVVLGEAPQRLVAVTTTTTDAPTAADRPWVVFFTTGQTRRVGPTRLWTTFARTWAASGIFSLRVDVRGTGDSDGPDVETLEGMYDPSVVDDADAVLSYLEDRFGARQVTALGLCAGGYTGFHAALRDPRISHVVVVNPLTLRWRPEDETLSLGADVRASLFQPGRWRLLLQGRVPIRRVVTVAARAATAHVRGGVGRLLARKPEDDLGASVLDDVRRLVGRGCRVTFVLAVGDASSAYLARVLGSDFVDVLRGAGASVELVEGADHTFRQLWSHEALRETIERHLDWYPADDPAARVPDRAGRSTVASSALRP